MDLGKISSVFYTNVVPMLNPLIYSLRNKDIKLTVRKSCLEPGGETCSNLKWQYCKATQVFIVVFQEKILCLSLLLLQIVLYLE